MKLIIAVGIIVLLFIICAVLYNKMIILRNYIKEAFSTMDVYLKRRWDLIPNLVETVKGYSIHEKETFEKITGLRQQNYQSLSNDDKMKLNNELSKGLTSLFAVAENYPELKANQNYLKLQEELSNIETDIANSRKYYNGTVREYNTFIQCFPNNIFANMFNFKSENMFEIDTSERQNTKVQF